MKTFLFITIFLFSSTLINGQEDSVLNIPGNTLSWYNAVSNTDSLRALLKTAEGRDRIHLLCELSFSLTNAGIETASYISWLTEALELSEELDYNNGRVMALFILADYYGKGKSDTLRSLKLLRQAEYFFDDDTHWTLKYRIWESAWQNMILLNQMDSAIYYSRKPLELLDKDTAWLAHIRAHYFLMRQAVINNDHPQKKAHFESIVSILDSNHEYLGLIRFNLPEAYEELSIILANNGEYKRALDIMLDLLHNLKAIEVKHLKTEFYIAKILGRIARIYSHWGRYDQALNYFNKSIQYFDDVMLGYKSEIYKPKADPSFRLWSINAANQLEERAAVLIRTGDLAEATNDLLESIRVRTKHNDPLGVAMCYEKMGEIYALQGKFLEALNLYNSALDIKTEMLE